MIRKNKLLTEDNWMYARRECGIHEQMNHQNIVKLYDNRETETDYEMYMEYCDQADKLTDKIRTVIDKLIFTGCLARLNLRWLLNLFRLTLDILCYLELNSSRKQPKATELC